MITNQSLLVDVLIPMQSIDPPHRIYRSHVYIYIDSTTIQLGKKEVHRITCIIKYYIYLSDKKIIYRSKRSFCSVELADMGITISLCLGNTQEPAVERATHFPEIFFF